MYPELQQLPVGIDAQDERNPFGFGHGFGFGRPFGFGFGLPFLGGLAAGALLGGSFGGYGYGYGGYPYSYPYYGY